MASTFRYDESDVTLYLPLNGWTDTYIPVKYVLHHITDGRRNLKTASITIRDLRCVGTSFFSLSVFQE